MICSRERFDRRGFRRISLFQVASVAQSSMYLGVIGGLLACLAYPAEEIFGSFLVAVLRR